MLKANVTKTKPNQTFGAFWGKKRFQEKSGNCGEGHNKLSYVKTCTTCEFVPFCGHLVNKEGKKIPRCQ